MKTKKEKKTEKTEKKPMSKAKKKIIIGTVLTVALPFTGLGQMLAIDGIRSEIEEQKAFKRAVKESEDIGQACEELIAMRKSEQNEVKSELEKVEDN